MYDAWAWCVKLDTLRFVVRHKFEPCQDHQLFPYARNFIHIAYNQFVVGDGRESDLNEIRTFVNIELK